MKTRHQHQAEVAADLLVQSAINGSNDLNATRFLAPLPVEIIFKIASQLSQRDCLTCMAVCRSWYITAPQYLQNVWKTVHVSYECFPDNNARWTHFVCHYAKSIVLGDYTYHRSCSVIRKLIDCGCNQVDSLQVTVPYQITPVQMKKFLPLVKQLAASDLTQLTLDDISGNVDICNALYTYPSLVKFSLLGSFKSQRIGSRCWPDLPQFTRLTHLYLDSPVDLTVQLKLVLKRSPNLQYLAYGKYGGDDHTRRVLKPFPASINLNDVLSWCPKLISLEANGCLSTLDYRSVSDNLIQQDKSTFSGLRSLMVCEMSGYGADQVEPCILRNAGTLEFLAIEYISAWSAIMNKFHGPRLRMLILKTSWYSSIAWNIVIPDCPSMEYLEVNGHRKICLDISYLKQLKQLKHLKLSDLTLCYNHGSLKNLATQGSRITHIILESIQSVNDSFLEMINHLSTLEQLFIVFRNDDDYSDEGLLQFVTHLSRAAIQHLKLSNVVCSLELFLSAVGNLRTLHTFHFKASWWRDMNVSVDASHILHLLETSTNLKRVYFGSVMVTGTDGDPLCAFFKHKLQGFKADVSAIFGHKNIKNTSFTRC